MWRKRLLGSVCRLCGRRESKAVRIYVRPATYVVALGAHGHRAFLRVGDFRNLIRRGSHISSQRMQARQLSARISDAYAGVCLQGKVAADGWRQRLST